MGKGKFFHGLGPGEQGRPAGNPDTSPGSVRAKAPVVRDVVADVYGCEQTGSRSLRPSWVGIANGMYLQGLGSRVLAPPAVNPDTYLSRGSQGQGSGGQKCSRKWL